jgi:hypothetical protein
MKLKIYFSIILLLFVTVTACHKKQLQSKPDDLIPPDQIQEILKEVFLIESTLGQFRLDSLQNIRSSEYYYTLFKEHNITKKQFESSLAYYISDEDHIKRILQNVSEEFQEEQKAQEKEQQEKNNQNIENINIITQ